MSCLEAADRAVAASTCVLVLSRSYRSAPRRWPPMAPLIVRSLRGWRPAVRGSHALERSTLMEWLAAWAQDIVARARSSLVHHAPVLADPSGRQDFAHPR